MTNLAKRALSMATQDIKANRLFFGQRTTLAEVRRIYDMCVIAARRVENNNVNSF